MVPSPKAPGKPRDLADEPAGLPLRGGLRNSVEHLGFRPGFVPQGSRAAGCFRTAFENNLDERPRRWISRLQRYDRGRYRDESRLRNKLQKLSFIRKRPRHRMRSIGAVARKA
jgi:hypothetical protein